MFGCSLLPVHIRQKLVLEWNPVPGALVDGEALRLRVVRVGAGVGQGGDGHGLGPGGAVERGEQLELLSGSGGEK